MRGKIIAIDGETGFVAYEYNGGEYGYFEVFGCDASLEVGVEIMGNLESVGDETITILPSGEKISIFIQDYSMSLKSLSMVINQDH